MTASPTAYRSKGTAGADRLSVNGDAAGVTTSGLSTTVAVQHQDPTDVLDVESLGGDDNISAVGLAAQSIALLLDGGEGNDTLAGGQGIETLSGGDGNDSIDGNGGNDAALLGAGDDTFVWDPGDGSDLVEGGDGADTMVFNGANVAEQVELSANGNRLKFTATQANITMDTAGVETVDFNALGGADLVTVHDLTGTDVTDVNVDLAGSPRRHYRRRRLRPRRRRRHQRRRRDRRARRCKRFEGGRPAGEHEDLPLGSGRPARHQHAGRQRHRELGGTGRRRDPALRGRRARPLEEDATKACGAATSAAPPPLDPLSRKDSE